MTEAATIWSGPRIVFTKATGADPTQAINQDRLTSHVWLTRGASQGLYNVVQEVSYSHSSSPADTAWATGTTANYTSLTYVDWETWATSVGGPPASPGVNAVLYLKTDDIYIDIKFLSWGQRSGGFSYERSTPGAIAATTTTTATATTTTVASTTTTTQAPAFSLPLTAGWNLVGNSFGGLIDAAAAFGDTTKVITVWKWVAPSAKWAFFTPSLIGQSLGDYANSKGYDILTIISPGEGFWVNAKTAGRINLTSGNPITAATLVATLNQGWNLASLGETWTPKQFCDAQSGGVTTLWAWDATNSAWYFYAPSLDTSGSLGSYITSKGYLDFTTNGKTLGPGVGFWVNKP